jgi:hypothetical protein
MPQKGSTFKTITYIPCNVLGESSKPRIFHFCQRNSAIHEAALMATIYLLCGWTKASAQIQYHHTLGGGYIFPVTNHMEIQSLVRKRAHILRLAKT